MGDSARHRVFAEVFVEANPTWAEACAVSIDLSGDQPRVDFEMKVPGVGVGATAKLDPASARHIAHRLIHAADMAESGQKPGEKGKEELSVWRTS